MNFVEIATKLFMHPDLLYRIAVTMIPNIGPVLQKRLIQHFETASDIFTARKKELCAVDGISEWLAKQIKSWNDFSFAESELVFLEKHHICPLFINDKAYPQRLINCYDAPIMLYFKGHCNLNEQKIISIIGTRTNTLYGKQIAELIIEQLPKNVLIVSGLAFGIDAIAHKAALKNELNTLGVLAHGLDDLYPAQHRSLAKEIVQQGGLLTEFNQKTKPDKHNFPKRNRIVAGIADATIVIETAIKGGSMITADLAFQYNRELFAVPGKINDTKSAGCLKLIQENKANLYTSIEHFLTTMNWESKIKSTINQLSIFASLTPDEQLVVELINKKGQFALDELKNNVGFSSSKMASVLLSLELQNIIHIIPGKMIALV